MEIQTHIINKFNDLYKDENVSKKIENVIFKHISSYCKNAYIPINLKNQLFKNLYIAKARQIYFNLKEDSYVNNKQIKTLINKNKIKLDNIASYTYKQLYPQNWKKYNKDLEILNKDIADFDKEVQTTDAFTCPKCKKKKCVYTEFQTRSADEPSTLFITCTYCNYFFRQ